MYLTFKNNFTKNQTCFISLTQTKLNLIPKQVSKINKIFFFLILVYRQNILL